MGTKSLVAGAAFTAYLIRLWWKWRQVVRSVGNLPGCTTVIAPMTLLSKLLPPIPFVNVGTMRELDRGYADFEAAGCDAYAHKHIWPEPGVSLFVADPHAIKEITTHRSRFPKPVQAAPYQMVAFFGNNIVISEGEEWKRYRKISAPAFLERNNRLVWDETIRIVHDMISNVWKCADTVSIDHVLNITFPIALFVVGAAGFGRRMSFTDEDKVPSGFTMSFKDALYTVSESVIIKATVPKHMLGWTTRFRLVDRAFDELHRHMSHMIDARRHEGKNERDDLFSNLIGAADGDSGEELKLTDRELFSNMCMFLLAGHETTAHTLAFTLALLALYPDKQEKLYRDIQQSGACTGGRVLTYEHMYQMTYPLAVLYETLRFRPPVLSIQKYSEEDTTLNVQNVEGGSTAIPVPKGTCINLHTPGVQTNPHYWESPNEFKPERFLGTYNKEAFIPFSSGARACIGRRFFETEAVATLTVLISQYHVKVKEDVAHAGETHEQRCSRLMKTCYLLTTTPEKVSLIFERRK